MPWYTITDGFDTDFGVDEWHGHNAFIRDGDSVFRTYFINNRGDEAMGEHLELPRHDRSRTPGELGGLARGLPPKPTVRLVELARRRQDIPVVERPQQRRSGSRGSPTAAHGPPVERRHHMNECRLSPSCRRKHVGPHLGRRSCPLFDSRNIASQVVRDAAAAYKVDTDAIALGQARDCRQEESRGGGSV